MPADATGATRSDGTAPARTIDVRPIEEPPFDAIVAALGDLGAGETVEFVADALPLALLDALEARDWPYEAVRVVSGEWRVLVSAGENDGAGRAGERTRRPRPDRFHRSHS